MRQAARGVNLFSTHSDVKREERRYIGRYAQQVRFAAVAANELTYLSFSRVFLCCFRWHQPILDALVRLPPLSPGDAVFYHTGERVCLRKAEVGHLQVSCL